MSPKVPTLAMLQGITEMMGKITFIQFIQQEAIQSAALGAFMAIRHGSYKGLAFGTAQMRTCVAHLELVNNTIGYAAPFSQLCFRDFVNASKTNLEIYDDILFLKAHKVRQ